MTELGLIVGIDVVGLVLALLMWRSVSVRDAGPAPVRRLGSALERAARAFLWQEYRLIAAALIVLLALGIALNSAAPAASVSLSRLAVAFWCCLGLSAGAFGATLAGFVGAIIAVRGSVRVAVASATNVATALELAMRAAGSAGLFGETLSGLSLVGLFTALFATQGGFSLAREQALPLAAHVVLILPSFALGAAVAALILQRGGGAFHAASGVSSGQAGERDAGLSHDDARNPAVVAELVGDHVGASATRHADGFAAAAIANSAALILGTAISTASPGSDPLLLLALPLVVRAFGVIASGFGLFLVRSEEAGRLGAAILRGYLSTAVISVSAFGGISYWLFGEHFLPVFAAASLGLCCALLAAHALLLRLRRRNEALRDAQDALRVGSGALVASGLAAGVEACLIPVLVIAFGAALNLVLGHQGGLSSGPEVCSLMFVVAALSLSPFALSVATVGSIADSARGIVRMCSGDGELERRSSRLDDAGFANGAVARHYGLLASALSALLVAWAIASQAQSGSGGGNSPSLAIDSVLVSSGALGAVVVLAYAGSVARAALRGSRELTAEIERQLRGFPREHGVAQVPLDYTPSYRSCIELGTTLALRRALLPIALGIAAPVLLGVLLRLSFQRFAPELARLGLTWFVVIASLTGLGFALAVDAARVTLGSIRRAQRGNDGASGVNASLSADAMSDIFGNAASPALQALVKAAAAAALIITPFLV